MNKRKSFHKFYVPLLTGLILMALSGCAQQAAVAPSYALRTQLQEIKNQQAAQQQQLQEMKQLIGQLQGQLAAQSTPGTSTVATAPVAPQQPHEEQISQATINIPQLNSTEMVQIADSASSFLNAFSSLASGQYYAAENGFNSFLASYPEHQYAPNARFWLASAQAAQNKTSQAVNNLRQIVADPAGQEKAPAALVQLIQLYQQAGLQTQASEAADQLRDAYGHTAEARYYFQSNSELD